MNKNYYKLLAARYMEANLSPLEERRLASFLSSTEDPEFNGIKAVMAFFAQGKAVYTGTESVAVRHPWIPVSIAAAVSVLVISGAMLVGRQTKNREASALASMESTLSSIFSSGADFELELTELLDK